MKRILFLLIIVPFCFSAKAQYVTIPDANFVTWLKNKYPTCMNGNKMDTTCSRIVNELRITLDYSTINNVWGLQFFDKLEWFSAVNCGLDSLPPLPAKLTLLQVPQNNIAKLPALPVQLGILNIEENEITALPALPLTLKKFYCSKNVGLVITSLPDSLETFYCVGIRTPSLPVFPSRLIDVDVSENNLTTLPALPKTIKKLDCHHNDLDSLPTLPDSLTNFDCSSNYSITKLPALPPKLIQFDCSYCNIAGVFPQLPPSIQSLSCFSNSYITGFTNLPQTLSILEFGYNKVTALPALPDSLVSIGAGYNLLDELPALPAKLTTLYCPYNNLTELPLLPATLTNLTCNMNKLTGLPPLPNSLAVFVVMDNKSLKCIPPLKKFTGNGSYFSIENTGVKCLPNVIAHQGTIYAIDTMPVCDLYNANGCEVAWNIYGHIYQDGNGDCKRQLTEPNANGVKVNLYNGNTLLQSGYFSTNGYSFKTGVGTYRVQVDTNNLPAIVTCPASGDTVLNVTSSDSLQHDINFGLICKSGLDLAAKSVFGTFRPGTVSVVAIGADKPQNSSGLQCNTGATGMVSVAITGPVHYVSPAPGAPSPASVNNNTLTWNVADFDSASFNIMVATDTTAQLDDQVCFTVTVTVDAGDYDLSNNTFAQCVTVRNSFDPNDKQVSPPGNIDTTTKWLTYTVRFQNTGTDTAIHIYILDTLSQNVDVSSFQLLNSSHKGITQIYGNGIVKFNFPNIMLPDSNVNEPLSHGYVQYKVKLKDNLPLGTQIENTAYIYFDFNAPVVTNTTLNTITEEVATAVSPLSLGEGMRMRIYPNPATSQLYISATGFVPQQLAIYNVSGQQVWEQKFTTQLDISNLTNGIYFIELLNDNTQARTRFVKM